MRRSGLKRVLELLALAIPFYLGPLGYSYPATLNPPSNPLIQPATTNSLGWITNGPAVYRRFSFQTTNIFNPLLLPINRPVNTGTNNVKDPIASLLKYQKPQIKWVTNEVFDHFVPLSLNNLVWTNFLAHTNDKTIAIWAERSHPTGWPAQPPIIRWNTNSLIWGMTGSTALSPCWEVEGSSGQVPVTALTRRHGYARGHGMGPDGLRTNFSGMKVWFITTNNAVIQATVAREVVRTSSHSKRDYSILLFSKDLPDSIEPMRVVTETNLLPKYPRKPAAPRPIFETEQCGNVSAGLPGFTFPTWKGGDSGSPELLPLENELVFFGGRSTSGPSPEMQADMDTLCKLEGLNPKKYQLQWVDLSAYPSY